MRVAIGELPIATNQAARPPGRKSITAKLLSSVGKHYLKAHTWTIIERTEASEAALGSVEDERSEWRRRSRHCSRY